MQSMSSIVIGSVLIGSTFVLWSCQRGTDIPIDIRFPSDATDAQKNIKADNTVHEVQFTVQRERDSLATVDQIEGELTKVGYVRCTASNGNWSVISKRQDRNVVKENRLLRFYRT